jgi:hypothetical protein
MPTTSQPATLLLSPSEQRWLSAAPLPRWTITATVRRLRLDPRDRSAAGTRAEIGQHDGARREPHRGIPSQSARGARIGPPGAPGRQGNGHSGYLSECIHWRALADAVARKAAETGQEVNCQ